MGALLSGVNPKNLILTATAATSIAAAGLSPGEEVVVLAVFTVVAAAGVAAPIIV